MASVHTKCRAAAEPRLDISHVAAAATPSTPVALTVRSSATYAALSDQVLIRSLPCCARV
jgi:hypothetical protein